MTAPQVTAPTSTTPYKEDIALIRDLGCKAYRFSVAWPRALMQATF
jgi:beta-glucosidase/6-phospho-beta-glucosidase/beta-galactosidase